MPPQLSGNTRLYPNRLQNSLCQPVFYLYFSATDRPTSYGVLPVCPCDMSTRGPKIDGFGILQGT